MTYKNLIDLRDTTIMIILANDVQEEKRMEFMDKFKAACQTADIRLIQEQLPILLDGQKAQAVEKHLNDQITI